MLESKKLLAPTPVYIKVLPHKHIITHASVITWLAFRDIIYESLCVHNLLINSQQIRSVHVRVGGSLKTLSCYLSKSKQVIHLTCENETTKYEQQTISHSQKYTNAFVFTCHETSQLCPKML